MQGLTFSLLVGASQPPTPECFPSFCEIDLFLFFIIKNVIGLLFINLILSLLCTEIYFTDGRKYFTDVIKNLLESSGTHSLFD